jgi:hypothetical protein
LFVRSLPRDMLSRRYASRGLWPTTYWWCPYNVWPVCGDTERATCRRFHRRRTSYFFCWGAKILLTYVVRPRVFEYSISGH